MIKITLIFSICFAVSIGFHLEQAMAGACVLPMEAYKAPKDAKYVSMTVKMPDGEIVNVNSKTDSFISVTHKKSGESYTFKVNTKGQNLAIEMFAIAKDTSIPQLTEVLDSKRPYPSSDTHGVTLVSSLKLTFNVLTIGNSAPKGKKNEANAAGQCCIYCGGGWSVCCCCCCACGLCCHPQ